MFVRVKATTFVLAHFTRGLRVCWFRRLWRSFVSPTYFTSPDSLSRIRYSPAVFGGILVSSFFHRLGRPGPYGLSDIASSSGFGAQGYPLDQSMAYTRFLQGKCAH